MPTPKNGETRMPVDVPRKIKDLLESVKADTGQDLKKLVAWACYQCYRDYVSLTFADIRQLRSEYEEWLMIGPVGPKGKIEN